MPLAPGDHRPHEALVAGDVDEAEAALAEVELGEAELDRDPAPPLLGEAVGVAAGQRRAPAPSCRGRCGRRCRPSAAAVPLSASADRAAAAAAAASASLIVRGSRTSRPPTMRAITGGSPSRSRACERVGARPAPGSTAQTGPSSSTSASEPPPGAPLSRLDLGRRRRSPPPSPPPAPAAPPPAPRSSPAPAAPPAPGRGAGAGVASSAASCSLSSRKRPRQRVAPAALDRLGARRAGSRPAARRAACRPSSRRGRRRRRRRRARSARRATSLERPGAEVVDHRDPALARQRRQLAGVGLLGEADDAEVGLVDAEDRRRPLADRRGVVGEAGAVGRPDLDQGRRRSGRGCRGCGRSRRSRPARRG